MPYVESIKFPDLIRTASVADVRFFMKNLLLALRHIHSFGIIHRDVKPANFLYDPVKKKFGLIDFGLAQKGPVVPTTETSRVSYAKKTGCVFGQVYLNHLRR